MTKTLVASVALDAYTTSKIITMPAHNLEWYAGYKPGIDTPVNILLEVGPVGGTMTDNYQWETFETPTGNGHDCPDGYHWDDIAQACVKDTGDAVESFWDKYGKYILAAGGVAAVVSGAALLLSDKKKK